MSFESAGKPSLGPREDGVVSTGRFARAPEILEVNLGVAVIPRGRRTPVDVRRRKHGMVGGEIRGSMARGRGQWFP